VGRRLDRDPLVGIVLDVAVLRLRCPGLERLILPGNGRVARAGRELLGSRVAELGGILGHRLGLCRVGELFELRLVLRDDRVGLVIGLVQRELLVGGHAAVP